VWRSADRRPAGPGLAPWIARQLEATGAPGWLWPRWLFLRALGLIFLSAFHSLADQIHGLIGERGILPADAYLGQVAAAMPGLERFWFAPTLLWAGAGDRGLTVVVAAGVICSLLLVANVWPRLTSALATLLFLSCSSALQDFSSYQSDGMLLEAGFLGIFFAPRGVRPGLGRGHPPSRASLFLLQWEWFRIYFWSGVVKLASGDPHWRDWTAMDRYYETGPLPSWPGWYVQHLPHAYHAATVALTLLIELVLVWALFLPRRFRIALFLLVTPFQLGIIATANYAFLNYLVLSSGVLLLDDRAVAWVVERTRRLTRRRPLVASTVAHDDALLTAPAIVTPGAGRPAWRRWGAATALSGVLYGTVAETIPGLFPGPLGAPARVLEPFRIANEYGLFAVMTEERLDIEFQGTRDGRTWIAYPFRHKPQDRARAPGIYAPYQPRLDWNLWFASLGAWRQSPWVVLAQARLLEGSPAVLSLFAGDPFRGAPPIAVRTVLWRYRFSTWAEHRATGRWWDRELIGPFAGTVLRGADGRVTLTESP
jgi:lipase maturation factor 1